MAEASLGRLDFTTLRGGTPDERSPADKPYSAASYSAQYGMPVEDASGLLERAATHGDVRRLIYQIYLSDEDFREAALQHVTRPYGMRSEAEKLAYDIEMTTQERAAKIRRRLKPGEAREM